MPVAFWKASRVGRVLVLSSTSMYWVQFDQLTIFSLSDRSVAAAAVFGAAAAVPPDPAEGFLPAEPHAARNAAAPRPAAPIIAERRDTSPRASAARKWGSLMSFMKFSVGGWWVVFERCRRRPGWYWRWCDQRGSGLDVGHDVLDAGVVLESVHRQVLAVTAVLETPVRHLGNDRDVRVDPDTPEVELPAHPHGPAEVLRPDAGGEAVLYAVGPGQRLRLVGELLHGDDRTEDLGLDLLVVLSQAGEHCRLEEVPLAEAVRAVAAGRDAGVVGQTVDHARHVPDLVGVVDRAEQRVRVVRHTDLGRALGVRGERVDEVVVDARTREHAGGRRAVLPG